MNDKELLELLKEAVLDAQTRHTNPTLSPKTNYRLYKCNLNWCERPAYAKGLCNAHYLRKRADKNLRIPIKHREKGGTCKKCNSILDGSGGWGFCKSHYNKERYAMIKTTLINALGGKCQSCKNTFPICVYDFHHLKNKDDGVPNMINTRSLNIIAKEANKCILLCANCHRLEHFGEKEPCQDTMTQFD